MKGLKGLIRAGQGRNNKKTGATPQKVMSSGVPRGMNNVTGALVRYNTGDKYALYTH